MKKWNSPFVQIKNAKKAKELYLWMQRGTNIESIDYKIPEYENNETAPNFANHLHPRENTDIQISENTVYQNGSSSYRNAPS